MSGKELPWFLTISIALNQPPGSSEPASRAGRLVSLDALRGFDMFWIIGADALVYALNRMSQTGPTRFLADQLEHVAWEGFHFYDLIFALFVFIVGASLVFSLNRTIDEHGRATAVRRVIRRSVLLFVLGILYSGGLSQVWPNVRLMGVLNRIALAYFFAGLIYCWLRGRPRLLAGVTAALLTGYWILLQFVPFPDVRPDPGSNLTISKETGFTNVTQLNFAGRGILRGTYAEGVNLANYIDQRWLPGRKYDGTWDPEGLLSTLPAVASCLTGVLAGLLLLGSTIRPLRKVAWLMASGAVAVLLGFFCGQPVIKKIWTSSFVLVTSGYSAMLLGTFYLVIDVWDHRRWCQPLVWMGMNSITVYLANEVVGGFDSVAARLVGGSVKGFLDRQISPGMGELAIALTGLCLAFGLVYFLHRRKIFLRV